MTKHTKAVAAFLGSAAAGPVLAWIAYLLWGGPCRTGIPGIESGMCVFDQPLRDVAQSFGVIGLVVGVIAGLAFEASD